MNEGYRNAVKAAFMNPQTFASTLFAILVDAFGSVEFVNWDPETIQAELRDEFGLKFRELPEETQDKLMIIIGVYGTDLFYNSLEWFCHACNALNGDFVMPMRFDPPTVEEMAWACMEVAMQQAEEGDMASLFNAEIKAYVGQQADREGYTKLPATLDWADAPSRATDNALDPAGLGAEMFAASVQSDQEKFASVEASVKEKTRLLGEELARFPFMNRSK